MEYDYSSAGSSERHTSREVHTIGGIVLCGGRSSRMGQSKAWLPTGRETMLQRIVGVVRSAVDPVIVVAAAGQNLPVLPEDVEIVRDETVDRGPLQGIVTGMRMLKGQADAVYVSGCDVPFLTTEFVRRVTDHLASKRAKAPLLLLDMEATDDEIESSLVSLNNFRHPLASVPFIQQKLHPLAAAYSFNALPILEAELAAHRLRLTDLFDILPTSLLTEADLGDLESLRNVNTPEEYEQALRELLN